MDVPEIKTTTDLSFKDAVTEYRDLTRTHKAAPQYGWAHWLESKFQDRLTFLRKEIANHFLET